MTINDNSKLPLILRKELFLEKANEKHNNRYTYDLSKYVNAHNNIKIICVVHGSFLQTPKKHLEGGGCPDCCGRTKLSFVEKASKVHNNYFDYSNTIYNGSRNNINIICPKHGEFIQRADSHLRGSTCPICSLNMRETGNGYNIKPSDPDANDICYLYKIKMLLGDEKFYKIGITNDINKRHRNIHSQSNYNIEILNILIDTRYNCFVLEKKLLKKYKRKNVMYIPNISFDGSGECYKM